MIKVKYSELLFYLFFGVLFFAKGIGLYDGQTLFKLLLIIAVVCLLGKFSLEKYNKEQMIVIVGVLLLGGTTYLLTGEKGLLLNCLLIAGLHHMDTKKIFRLAGVIWSIAVVGTIIVSLFHMEDTVYKVHAKLGLGHVFRWSMGYGHPNVLQITYFIMAIIIVYLIGDKFKLWHGILLFLGNCFFFLYSLSYTGFAVVLCLLIGRVYLSYRPQLTKAEKVLLQMIFPLCVLLSLVGPVILRGEAFRIIDKLMNTRLRLAKHFLVKDYIHLFGNRLSEIITNSVTMDNAYVFAFITYGIIPFTLIVVVTLYAIRQMCRQEKYIEMLIFAVISIGGLTEPFLYNTSFKNLSVILIGEVLFARCKGEEKYSLLEKYNQKIQVCTRWFQKILKQIHLCMKYDGKKVIVAFVGAFVVCVTSNGLISYPKGYVVYRVDCAGLEEVYHYYGEESGYEGYREMEEFTEGELVEYYSGNIVILEKIRNSSMALFLGFVMAYVVYGIRESVVKREKKHEKK